MYQVIEKDWKLFRKLLPGWQEAYMERLAKEYIELLSRDRQASDKFWELDQRIKQDKRRTGVLARGVSRSNMFQLIINLIYEETISEDDLKEFSESLRENIHVWLEIDRRYRDE
nr:multidrug transporter [uncultured Ruminococcus sp.]